MLFGGGAFKDPLMGLTSYYFLLAIIRSANSSFNSKWSSEFSIYTTLINSIGFVLRSRPSWFKNDSLPSSVISNCACESKYRIGLVFSQTALARPPEDKTCSVCVLLQFSWPSLWTLVWSDDPQHTGRETEREKGMNDIIDFCFEWIWVQLDGSSRTVWCHSGPQVKHTGKHADVWSHFYFHKHISCNLDWHKHTDFQPRLTQLTRLLEHTCQGKSVLSLSVYIREKAGGRSEKSPATAPELHVSFNQLSCRGETWHCEGLQKDKRFTKRLPGKKTWQEIHRGKYNDEGVTLIGFVHL